MNKPKLVVADDVVVRLDYTLTLDDGEIVDSSAEDGPLEFLQGHGQIIPGLEEGLMGMAIGEEKEIVVTPDYAYGEYDPDAFELIPHEEFPDDFELEPGMALELYDEETGEPSEAFVSEIRKEGVVVDFNHPLAGETLYFQVKVSGLRAATPEEIEHGHVHGAGHAH
jgi:FKBP-type peptidyl-prolyl cis-trans isomerase SlyD